MHINVNDVLSSMYNIYVHTSDNNKPVKNLEDKLINLLNANSSFWEKLFYMNLIINSEFILNTIFWLNLNVISSVKEGIIIKDVNKITLKHINTVLSKYNYIAVDTMHLINDDYCWYKIFDDEWIMYDIKKDVLHVKINNVNELIYKKQKYKKCTNEDNYMLLHGFNIIDGKDKFNINEHHCYYNEWNICIASDYIHYANYNN